MGNAEDTGGQDGQPRAFNDRGQVVFRAFFTDSTVAVVSALVGGPIRLADTPPIHGPARQNTYRKDTPLVVAADAVAEVPTSDAADNNAGCLNFASPGSGEDLAILLRYDAVNTRLESLHAYLTTAGANGGG